jgi:hypothetical protein
MNNPQWGKATEDLAISIQAARPRYKVGEPVTLDVRLKNVGKTPTRIVVRPDWGDYTLEVRRGSTVVPKTPFAEQMIEAAALGPRANAELGPGEVRTTRFELDKGFDLSAPGSYKVIVTRGTYKKGTLDQFATVTSNDLTLQIDP